MAWSTRVLFDGKQPEEVTRLINLLLRNVATPRETLIDMELALGGLMDGPSRVGFLANVEQRWAQTPLDALPPTLGSEGWQLRPDGTESGLGDRIIESVRATKQPAKLLAFWLFAKTRLPIADLPNGPALLKAFYDHHYPFYQRIVSHALTRE